MSIDLLNLKILNELKKETESDIIQENLDESETIQGNEDEKCKDCDSTDIIQKDGRFICRNCGNIFSCIIDDAQEWRYYGQYDNKSSDPARCDMPTNELIPNACMGTLIGTSNRESYDIRRIRKIHTWNSISYKDSTLLKSFNTIATVGNNNDITNCIIEEAKHMFKQVYDIKTYRKAKKKEMEAAALQWACKLKGVPRDSTEIANMFGITKKEMRKGAKQFEEIWTSIQQRKNKDNDDIQADTSDSEFNIDNDEVDNILKTSDSLAYLHRCCSRLNFSNDIFNICKNVCEYIEKEDILIKHIPLSRTAGIIFFTCNCLNITVDKQLITNICNISEVTINKCHQKLLKISPQIIENTKLKDYINLNKKD